MAPAIDHWTLIESLAVHFVTHLRINFNYVSWMLFVMNAEHVIHLSFVFIVDLGKVKSKKQVIFTILE